jgi:hypothetical protein
MVNYITLVGNVQSGKTNEEILFCNNNINNGIPVIFVTRNIKADQMQLCARFTEFNQNKSENLNVKILSHLKNEDSVKLM